MVSDEQVWEWAVMSGVSRSVQADRYEQVQKLFLVTDTVVYNLILINIIWNSDFVK